MNKDLFEVTDYNEPGYKALVYFEGWRVAILNDDTSKYRLDTLKQLERHNNTDEVFVLLQGHCTLLIGEEKCSDSAGRIAFVAMEPNKLYNVRKGVWHNLIGEKDMVLLIVENSDTSKQNTDYIPISIKDIKKSDALASDLKQSI